MRGKAMNMRGQRGVILIWVAMFLVIVMAFMSLGIDMSKLSATRTQLQNAADAAALAGVSAVDFTTGTLIPDSVVARAQSAAAGNKAFIHDPQPVIVAAGDIQIIDGDKVKVIARREGSNAIVTYVAQVLGVTSLAMKASATARLEPAGSVLCGIVPLGVVPPDGENFQTGCSPGYVLKTSEGEQGNYGAVTFPECNTGHCAGMPSGGASTFRCLVGYGYCCDVRIGDEIESQPGNLSSFRKAIVDRFKRDTDQRQDICYSEYAGNGERVVVVPIVDPLGEGRSVTTVRRFGAFFIKNIPGSGEASTLEGEFIFYVAAATGGGDSEGAVAYAIRLVD